MRVDLLDARDDDRFAAWYAALSAGATAGRHAPLVVSAGTMRSQLLVQTRAVRHALGVFERDRCLGTAVLERDTEHNTHLGEVDVNVPPEHRRRGVGSLLVDALSETAAAAGVTTLLGEVAVVGATSPGLDFARQHGFASVHTEDHLVLDLPLAPARLADLVASSDAEGHGYALTSWTGPTPREHLPALAQLKTGMNAEVPTGEVDADVEVVDPGSLAASDERLHDRGYSSLMSMVTAPGGVATGYSQLLLQGDDLVNAIQDDTYVLAQHRGHRIGTWLKASNLARLQATVPRARHVHTWTDETNDAMQAINAAFGFRSVEVMHEVQRGGR